MNTIIPPTITSALEQINNGTLTPLELTEACHRQIDRLNPQINAFITVISPEMSEIEETKNASIYGIPLAVKDLYEMKGVPTTSGTPFFKDHIPENDAVIIEKFKKAGAVITGKTNTHEIALGVTGINPHFGTVRNPWNTDHITGGSSSGSAAAVAAGMSLAALGTDTGGSIRIPASLCGIVGLKPTYGRSSLRGVAPLSWNLDHAGPLARSVRDAAILLQIMAGYDPLDPSCTDTPTEDYQSGIEDGIQGWRVALAAGEYIEEADPEVLSVVREAAKMFKSLGATLTEVDMSHLREAAVSNGIMVQADAAAYHRDRLSEHPEWFGADIRQRLEFGRSVTSTDYVLARRTQTEMRRRFDRFFDTFDILLLPATPVFAPPIEGNNAIEQARKLTRFTAPFNLTGLPAMSVPCGYSADGLPIGLQIVGRWWHERQVLRAGYAFEQATEWHTKLPNL